MAPIHERIRDDLLVCERTLWTALTSADPPPAVERLCNPEANLIFPRMEVLTLEGEDFEKALQPPFHRFDKYNLSDVRVIIIDLMAGSVTYRIDASRGSKEYHATGSTTWSQGSDGEWRICVHQETRL